MPVHVNCNLNLKGAQKYIGNVYITDCIILIKNIAFQNDKNEVNSIKML